MAMNLVHMFFQAFDVPYLQGAEDKNGVCRVLQYYILPTGCSGCAISIWAIETYMSVLETLCGGAVGAWMDWTNRSTVHTCFQYRALFSFSSSCSC